MKIWDLATRIYHWLQAILFIGLMASGLSGSGPHVQLGLALFTLIIWRFTWGFVGSETNRFRQFLRSPSFVIRYVFGKESSAAGHNPAGGWMVMVMLATLFLQCISGLALAGFLDNLPLADQWLTDTVFSALETMHMGLANLLPLIIATHVGAILIYKLRAKPLTWAMVVGIQPSLLNQQKLHFVSQFRAVGVLVVATSVTIAIVALA